jgi:hypothetical protein
MPGGVAGLQNLRAVFGRAEARNSMGRQVSDNYVFLFAILAGNVSSIRFAGSLGFAENDTFRAKSVTRKCDQSHE